MSGLKSRNKGHSFERKIAHMFREFFPKASRKLEYQASEVDGTDIAYTGNLRLQLKCYKQYAPISKIKEVQPKEGSIPALITKGDREPIVICLELDDFFKILRDPSVLQSED